MPQTSEALKPKVLEYLRRLAPYSIVDKGIDLARNGNVRECSRSGNTITSLTTDENETYSVRLSIVGGHRVEAECRCSTASEMQEQWCKHAVASLWQATELDFFEPLSGFAASESTMRLNVRSSEEIAEVLAQLADSTPAPSPVESTRAPDVEIRLDCSTDRLGVQVRFWGVPQEPNLFDASFHRSSRELDNSFLQLLEDDGSWDESGSLWYLSASSHIEVIVGLAQEYKNVRVAQSGEPITFSRNLLQACLNLTWQKSAAELEMCWVLPNGESIPRASEVMGTGPYWTMVDNTLYRISPAAARIASIFPHSPRITIPKGQTAPILAVLGESSLKPWVVILNEESQPSTEVHPPSPVLSVSRRENTTEHFTSQTDVTLIGQLRFEYPSPPARSNVVYLPDRKQEAELRKNLSEVGFQLFRERGEYILSGDAALDLLSEGTGSLGKEWTLEGLDRARSTVKFSKLDMSISLSDPEQQDSKGLYNVDWFECKISLRQDNANIPISLLFRQPTQDDRRWIRLENGAFAKAPTGQVGRLKATLGLIDSDFRLSNTIRSQISTAQALGLRTIHSENLDISVSNRLNELFERLSSFKGIRRTSVSKKFKGKLRTYQRDGLAWLTFLNEFSLGGVLADEMGLGKTVQTLALLQRVHEKPRGEAARPSLIVAPTSVITNWAYEARRFTPGLSVLVLHGPHRRQHFAELHKYDLVVTSYALLRLDRFELERCEFEYLVLDEAQNIKNPSAAVSRSAKALRARHRLALSGTPTENRPLELWSLFDFLMPGYLGSIDFFRNQLEKPILEGGRAAEESTAFLRAKTRPFILRRMKAQVEKDLPDKIESELHTEMTPSQQELYLQVLNEVRPQVFQQVQKRGIRGASISILAALLRLRQICNHPNSIDAFKGIEGYDSGKFLLLEELLDEAMAADRKILLFTQFREMMSLIRGLLERKGIQYLSLDGSTKNRQSLIDQFNDDPEVRLFLISLKAGGTGLNLTAADTVILYDPWWNPAVESQAVDRAHRIGQTKNVTVYRLVTENSIEEKIMLLKQKKEKLVDTLINENAASALKLTQNELQYLFQLDPPST